MVIKATELAKTHGWFLTRQFENEANPDMHSRTTARDIIADFAGEPLNYRVTGYGTGGTLKCVARVLAKSVRRLRLLCASRRTIPLLGSGLAQQRNPDGTPAAATSGLQTSSDAGLDARFHSEAECRSGGSACH
jgi:cysteine synthase A